MINLSAKKKDAKIDNNEARKQGLIPAVVYGPGVENQSITIDAKEFEVVLKEAGETSLINLDAQGEKFTVLVKDMSLDAVTDKVIHIDFYAPNLKVETTAMVPLQFVGEALAIKDLKGTLVKNIHELEVKCLPQDIPHEISIDISKLATFEDHFCVKDLSIAGNVQILKNPEEIIAFVARPADVEKELEVPIEGDVEKVEKIEKEKKEEVPADAPAAE
jgi:large subunit ribosomal protein L25